MLRVQLQNSQSDATLPDPTLPISSINLTNGFLMA